MPPAEPEVPHRVDGEDTEERSVERVKAFTDAVVAIALTLLVLPLLDTVSEVVKDGDTVSAWARHHVGDFAFFALSFWLISRYWRGHEGIFRHTERMTRGLYRANNLWMFAIVLMPVGTALLPARTDLVQVLLYVGGMLLCVSCQLAMALLTGRQPGSRMPSRLLAQSIASVVLMALALVVTCLVVVLSPSGMGGVAYFSLFMLAFAGRLTRRFEPRADRLLRRS